MDGRRTELTYEELEYRLAVRLDFPGVFLAQRWRGQGDLLLRMSVNFAVAAALSEGGSVNERRVSKHREASLATKFRHRRFGATTILTRIIATICKLCADKPMIREGWTHDK